MQVAIPAYCPYEDKPDYRVNSIGRQETRAKADILNIIMKRRGHGHSLN